MSVRRRMPGVETMFIQDCFELSISILMVERICAISAFTRMECSSPSAWYFTSTASASSLRSRLISHLGLSGRRLRWVVSRRCVSGLGRDLQDGRDLQNGGTHLQE